MSERNMGWPAWVAVVVMIAFVFTFIRALMIAREPHGTTSRSNLKQFGLVMEMYSKENDGEYPPIAPYEGVWMADLRTLFPEYLTDVSILFNPDEPDWEELRTEATALLYQENVNWERVHRLAAQHYVYTGWIVTEPRNVPEVVDSERHLLSGDDARNVVTTKREYHRLRGGVEKYFVTDVNNPDAMELAQATIPVMFERVSEKRRSQNEIDVLYMDGHVSCVDLDDKFPTVPEDPWCVPPPWLARD